MTDNEFQTLAAVAADSYIWRALAMSGGYLAAAWKSSRLVHSISAVSRQFSVASLTERIQTVAMVVGTASLAYWAILRMTPPYVATGIPHAWFLGVGLLALGATFFAGPFARAWPASSVGRLAGWVIR